VREEKGRLCGGGKRMKGKGKERGMGGEKGVWAIDPRTKPALAINFFHLIIPTIQRQG